LEIPEYNRDASPPDPEHLREEIMRESELITFNAIVRHQQPTTALLDRVEPVARG